jgi:predicted metalloprotease
MPEADVVHSQPAAGLEALMRWRGRRQSANIRDLRGSGGFGGGIGGFGRPRVIRRAGGGLGTLIVIVVVALLLGINPLEFLGGGPLVSPQGERTIQTSGSDEMRDFVATVLADTEDTWSAIFAGSGEDYPEPALTLFSDSVRSGCGFASAATGPFYCPPDRNVYIDLSFYDQLKRRFGAPGDFAQAYVLAHEVGHHVQNVLGVLAKVESEKQQLSEAEANAMLVKTELQADCLAGVWAHHTERRGLLEAGDVEEALNAAAAVGDDALQRQSQGYVVPDSFTHGTSEQRANWFRRGFETGAISRCDTFTEEL